MNRLVKFFWDSPTYGRDRATLISGFSIGTAGLLLNGAVLMLVLPLLLDPDDRDFRSLSENLEFGQLLALALLGGATALATLLIPLRLATVFWGPRMGRYFDQVVLSGISPLRFVIGKAASQNLFLGLIVFLLLPYLVLCLTLGGVNVQFFLAGLFLVWLYCLALALVTLWVSLYLNELLAALVVIFAATVCSALGCLPLPTRLFVMTPFPVLLHPVYSSLPQLKGQVPAELFPAFISCTACLVAVICVSLLAIHLGPLYGIIRENSTFGEVVRLGDSKRKRWFRLRLHIQRPSELAFFYENRGRAFCRNESLLRWGLGFGGLVLLSSAASLTVVSIFTFVAASGRGFWWTLEFHTCYLTIHGTGLVLAMIVFSHSKNSTYLRLPFAFGWKAEAARLDTMAFLLFALLSTAASIATPFYFEEFRAAPVGATAFPDLMYGTQGPPADYARIAVEGSLVISVAGLAVYAFHRLACLMTWIRSVTFVGVAAVYFIGVCVLPIIVAMFLINVPIFRGASAVADPSLFLLAMASPFTVEMHLFHELGGQFPANVSTIPFYVVHGVLLGLALLGIRRRGRKLRDMYLAKPVRGTRS